MIGYFYTKWAMFVNGGRDIIRMYFCTCVSKYKEWLLVLENVKTLMLMEVSLVEKNISLCANENGLIISGMRLRAGMEHDVAVENPAPIPYRAMNTRRGNAMRFIALDFIKEKPMRAMRGLYVILSKDKRKAMENIAADALFCKVDAYPPEERFYPLHVRPVGDTYYIPEKKIDQMAYVVNKFKKRSVDSIVSDVTWEASETDVTWKQIDEVVDLKTYKLKENIEKAVGLVDQIEQFSFVEEEDYIAKGSFTAVDSGKPFRSVYESTSSTTAQPKNPTKQYDYCIITCASEAILRPKPGIDLPRCVSDDERCTCKKIQKALSDQMRKGKSSKKGPDKPPDKDAKPEPKARPSRLVRPARASVQASTAHVNVISPFSNVVEDSGANSDKTTKKKRRKKTSSTDSVKSAGRDDREGDDDKSKKPNYQVFSVTKISKNPISEDANKGLHQKTSAIKIKPKISEVSKETSPRQILESHTKILKQSHRNKEKVEDTMRELVKERVILSTEKIVDVHSLPKEESSKHIHSEMARQSKAETTKSYSIDLPDLPSDSIKLESEKLQDNQSKTEKQIRGESVKPMIHDLPDLPSDIPRQSKLQTKDKSLDIHSETAKRSKAESPRHRTKPTPKDSSNLATGSPRLSKLETTEKLSDVHKLPIGSPKQSKNRTKTSETPSEVAKSSKKKDKLEPSNEHDLESTNKKSQDDTEENQSGTSKDKTEKQYNVYTMLEMGRTSPLKSTPDVFKRHRLKKIEETQSKSKRRSSESPEGDVKRALKISPTRVRSPRSSGKDYKDQTRGSILKHKSDRHEKKVQDLESQEQQPSRTTSPTKSEKFGEELKRKSTEKSYKIYKIDSNDLPNVQSEGTKKETSKSSRMTEKLRSSKDRIKQKKEVTDKKNQEKTVDMNLVKQKLEELDLPEVNTEESQMPQTESFLGTLIKEKLKEMSLQRDSKTSPRRTHSPRVSRHHEKTSHEKTEDRTDTRETNQSKLLESSPFFVKSVQDTSSSNQESKTVLERVVHKKSQRDSPDDDKSKKPQVKPNNEYMSFSLYKTKQTPPLLTDIPRKLADQKPKPAPLNLSGTSITSESERNSQFFLHKKGFEKRNSKLALFNNLFKKKSREFPSTSKQSQQSVKTIDRDQQKSSTTIMRLLKLTKKSKESVPKDSKPPDV